MGFFWDWLCSCRCLKDDKCHSGAVRVGVTFGANFCSGCFALRVNTKHINARLDVGGRFGNWAGNSVDLSLSGTIPLLAFYLISFFSNQKYCLSDISFKHWITAINDKLPSFLNQCCTGSLVILETFPSEFPLNLGLTGRKWGSWSESTPGIERTYKLELKMDPSSRGGSATTAPSLFCVVVSRCSGLEAGVPG